jgi:hypothetical protein
VKDQAPNPGTGEGGIDALLNTYLGTNALRVMLTAIPAGGIQRIRLEYISLCDFRDGTITYTYPFASSTFVQYPIETFSLSIHCTSSDDILADSLTGLSGTPVAKRSARAIDLEATRSKIYPTSDLTFSYTPSTPATGIDFASAANDSVDGHFVLMIKGPTSTDSSAILPKNVLFVVDRSSSTYGVALDESRAAIKDCLLRLRPVDRFNVIAFNSSVTPWSTDARPATAGAIDSASQFLDMLYATGGSNLQAVLENSLSRFVPDSLHHAIMVFSDGRSAVDPVRLRALNARGAGIFPVGIGGSINRARLELTAYQNYGFPTFLAITDPIRLEVARAFERIASPVLRDIRSEFGGNVYDVLPGAPGSLYAGSRYAMTGRFRTPSVTSFSFAGMAAAAPLFYDYSLTMSSDTKTYAFAALFWAKEKIDDLERRESVYGVSDSLKQLMISLSLRYGIRCKYTAYIADRTHPVAGVTGDPVPEARSYELLGNYPNPFNPSTRIRFVVHATTSEEATIRIYNIVGQLVAVLRVRLHGSGPYDVVWEGRDGRGVPAPTGIYYYTIEFSDGRLSGRMLLVR